MANQRRSVSAASDSGDSFVVLGAGSESDEFQSDWDNSIDLRNNVLFGPMSPEEGSLSIPESGLANLNLHQNEGSFSTSKSRPPSPAAFEEVDSTTLPVQPEPMGFVDLGAHQGGSWPSPLPSPLRDPLSTTPQASTRAPPNANPFSAIATSREFQVPTGTIKKTKPAATFKPRCLRPEPRDPRRRLPQVMAMERVQWNLPVPRWNQAGRDAERIVVPVPRVDRRVEGPIAAPERRPATSAPPPGPIENRQKATSPQAQQVYGNRGFAKFEPAPVINDIGRYFGPQRFEFEQASIRPTLPGCYNCGLPHHYRDCPTKVTEVFCKGWNCGLRGVTKPNCPRCGPAYRRRKECQQRRQAFLDQRRKR